MQNMLDNQFVVMQKPETASRSAYNTGIAQESKISKVLGDVTGKKL